MQFKDTARVLQPSWNVTEDIIHTEPLKWTKLAT